MLCPQTHERKWEKIGYNHSSPIKIPTFVMTLQCHIYHFEAINFIFFAPPSLSMRDALFDCIPRDFLFMRV